MTIHVYVGPTLARDHVVAIVPHAELHGPVQHGDLLRSRFARGDTVVIVDGNYHQTGSVRHKEILDVLDRGVTVVGCASMGALRAAELHRFGMIGIGRVFEMYRRGLLVGDDEVAVSHTEAPEYRALSEPLVNVRSAVHDARRAGTIDDAQAALLIEQARVLHYTLRTWRAIEASVERADPTALDAVRAVRARAEAHRASGVKTRDALMTLELVSSSDVGGQLDRRSWPETEEWRTRFLYDWRAQFEGATVEGVFVDDLAVARYQQIHDRDFPQRWRAFVLSQVGRHPQATVDDVLRVAADRGLVPGSLRPAQVSAWLTAREREALCAAEALVRILVRSFRLPRGLIDLVDPSTRLVVDWATTRRQVAEAFAVNEALAAEAPHWQVGHLRDDLLLARLAIRWEMPDASVAELDAAARDRGFAGFADAAEAFRPFFLIHHLAGTAMAHATGGHDA